MFIKTLCYIEYKDHYLMMHRTKKALDINEGKWIGVGGKFADRESPEECLQREVFEETGYQLQRWRLRGLITFIQENVETEYMCLFTADDFLTSSGRSVFEDPAFAGDDGAAWPVPDCSEGELAWIGKDQIDRLFLWEGDRIFLRLLKEDSPFFTLKLRYQGDELLEARFGDQ